MTTRTPRQIREFFNTKQGLVNLMFTLGVGNNEQDQIVVDGFGSIRALIEQYEHDIESFRTYLKNMNCTFGASTVAWTKVFFSSLVMSRLIGALYYGTITYHCCHILPDFNLLTPEFAMECFKFYESLKNEKNPESEKQIEIDIPDFTGASNWRTF